MENDPDSSSPANDSASIGSNSGLILHDVNRILAPNTGGASEKLRLENLRNIGTLLAAVRPFQMPFYNFAGQSVSFCSNIVGVENEQHTSFWAKVYPLPSLL